MGLFIGASLLTILEILDFLCEVGRALAGRGGAGPKSPGRYALATCPCWSSGVPGQGTGVLLEPKALPKTLWHQPGNSPFSLPCQLQRSARPHPKRL